jgi:hypothetical protein
MIEIALQLLRPAVEPANTSIRLPADSALRPGERVEGVVSGNPSPGQYTLRFARMELQLQSNLPIATGDTLRFQVVRVRDQLLLQLMDRAPFANQQPGTPRPAAASQAAQTGQPAQTALTTASQPLSDSARQNSAVAQAIRSSLPVATSLPPLLANLAAIGRGETATPQPRELANLAQRFVDSLPELQRLTRSEGLQQAVRDSGVFLESRLAQLLNSPPGTPALLEGDLKGNLLRLLQQLQRLDLAGSSRTVQSAGQNMQAATTASGQPATSQPAATAQPATAAQQSQPSPATTPGVPLQAPSPKPPMHQAALQAQQSVTATLLNESDQAAVRGELVREARGALARLQLSQLATLRGTQDGPNSANPQWLLDLPLRNGSSVDTIQVRIESRGAARARKGGRSWSLSLALDLGQLGAVDARVTLGEGGEISTLFWSENEETTAIIRQNLPILQRSLSESGLIVGRLGAFEGHPPARQDEMEAGHQTLLDLEA